MVGHRKAWACRPTRKSSSEHFIALTVLSRIVLLSCITASTDPGDGARTEANYEHLREYTNSMGP